MKKSLPIFLLGALLFGATIVYAATFHNYVCADNLTPAGTAPGCNLTNHYVFVGGAASYNDNTPVYSITPSQNYYITLAATAANGTNESIKFSGDSSVTSCTITSTTMTESVCAVGAIGAHGAILIRWDDAGTISALCIDDDGTSCSGGSTTAPSILGQIWSFFWKG